MTNEQKKVKFNMLFGDIVNKEVSDAMFDLADEDTRWLDKQSIEDELMENFFSE